MSDNLDNFPIEYLYRKGATTSECLELLQSKLPEIEEKYQKPALVYVWTGTCDITRKSKSNRGKVVVRSSGDKTINSVIQKYREILTFVLKRGGRVKFVGVPTYSVTLYNRHRNPRNTSSEAEADIEVDRQVRLLNSKIEELNKEIGRNTLKLNADLIKSRNHRNTVSFHLLEDGLHPGVTLARKWLRRIQLDIVREAFTSTSNEDQIVIDPQEIAAFDITENAVAAE
ncbi:MAG: hypothetical protein ABW185_13950 [Sedimenticola sp.]